MRHIPKTQHTLISFALHALCLTAIGLNGNANANAESAIDDVIKAPIVADGDVQGRATDYVINLDVSMEPNAPGIALAADDKVHVSLPDDFVFDEAALNDFPICSVLKPCPSDLIPDACVPGTLACTTVVFLQGFPQSPVLPDVSRDGNTLVLTPRTAVGPVIKNIHIIAKAIFNPGPGKYDVLVQHTDGNGNIVGEGLGKLHVIPQIRPSINITSVFASLVGGGPPFANTVYQTIAAGETQTPYPWNFLLWDNNGDPFTGIELLQVTEQYYLLRHTGGTIGHVSIEIPAGATGYSLTNTLNETRPGTPVIGIGPGGTPSPQVQRFEIQFDSGLSPVSGRYTTTLRLNNGNEVQMFVDVD